MKKRRIKRRFRNIRNKNKYKTIIIIIVLSLIILSLFLHIDNEIRPVIEVLSEMEATVLATQAVNDGVTDAIELGIKYDDLIDIVRDGEGDISLIQADTMSMNLFSSDIATLVQERIASKSEQPMKIPLGNILGSRILANHGPNININIKPIGAIMVNFFSEFEQAGINQTIHKIYVKIDTKIQIVLPLSNKSVDISSNVPVAETVIVGDVPDTYINMPLRDSEDLHHFIH